MEEAVADLTGGGERRLPGDPCLYLILRLNWSAQEQQKPISRWDPTSFHIKIWIRLPLLIFLLNLPASSPRNEPWENARAQPARSFARGKFLQRSWLATPPNGEPARWLLLTLLSLKRTLSVKRPFPHYLSPIPRGMVFKKNKKKTYLSRKEQITRLTTRNIASIRPMVKLQIFNCENSIIKSYLFRCRNSTFFAGVSCDQTKKN